MGKLFYVIGKSATGKDTIFQKLLENESLALKPLVLYTTRRFYYARLRKKQRPQTEQNHLSYLTCHMIFDHL